MRDTSTWKVLRRLVLPVYLPMTAEALGIGMLIPVLPLYLREEGLSFSVVSVILAAAGLGSMIGGLPAGSFLARLDDRAVLIASLIAMAISTALLGLTEAVAALVVFRVIFGVGTIGLRLSRQTYVSNAVHSTERGMAMSFIGGSFRLALLVGPVFGGYLVDQIGFTATFVFCGAVNGIGLLGAAPSNRASGDGRDLSKPPQVGLWAALWFHRALLFRGGLVPALVVAVRNGRYVVIALIAVELGVSPSATGALVAVGTAADLMLFPLSGYLMDRYGRLYAILPSLSLIAAGLLVLSAASSALMVGVAGLVMGIGNGVGAGSMLTLATDLAPPEAKGQVLAGLAVFQDFGTFLGPLIVGITADAIGLEMSAVVLAVMTVVAIAWLLGMVGETRDTQSLRR